MSAATASAISSLARRSLDPGASGVSSVRRRPHHPVDVDARRDHGLGVELAGRRRPSATCAIVVRRGGGHHRPEVARGLAVDEVAHPVGACAP